MNNADEARTVVAKYLDRAFGAVTFTQPDEDLIRGIVDLISRNLVDQYIRTDLILAGFAEAQETIRELRKELADITALAGSCDPLHPNSRDA